MRPAFLSFHPRGSTARAGGVLWRRPGFCWPQGQIISAISIQIPLASELEAANGNAKASSLYFLAFLCVFLVITGYLLNTLIITPLQRARDAKHIAANPTERLGERITLPKNRELAEFAQAFNDHGRSPV